MSGFAVERAVRMDIFLGLDDWPHFWRVLARLSVAVLFGAILGYNREQVGKGAGLRTHMLVALGSALFVVTALESGIPRAELSRVAQGLIIGIGFLGSGTILKEEQEQRIKGLTTAANIWLTCAVGMAVGFGWLWPAVIAVILELIIVSVIGWMEHWSERPEGHEK
jgi:putative Mg2+ transporter-C (MgtC) family protein